MAALEAGGYTVEDVVAMVQDPNASTPAMQRHAEARRQALVQQQQNREQQLQAENRELRVAETTRMVGERVNQDFMASADQYPAIVRYAQSKGPEVLMGIRDKVVGEFMESGNILDHNEMMRQAEQRIGTHLRELGIDLSSPAAGAGEKQPEQPRTTPAPRSVTETVAAPPNDPAYHVGEGDSMDDLDAFVAQGNWNQG